jgi:hypothetical protein
MTDTTTTDLAHIPRSAELPIVALVPRTFAEAESFSGALARSTLVPTALRGNAANVTMMIMAGLELGIAPIAAMRLFHVIEGVPKLSADAIAALCTRSPDCEYLEFSEQSSERVTWITKRRGRPEKSLTITSADMELAKLVRQTSSGAPGMHQKFPRQMLNARCKAELCRLVYPEICAGMISAEEARYSDAIDAEFTEVRSPSGFGKLPEIAIHAAADRILRDDEIPPDAGAVPDVGALAVAAMAAAEAPPGAPPASSPLPPDAARDAAFARARSDAAEIAKHKTPPISNEPIGREKIEELIGQMHKATDGRALSKIAHGIVGLSMLPEDREELVKTYNACADVHRKRSATVPA